MKLIETEIRIAASPERVWSILTNLEKFAEWNPFIKRAKGKVQEGEKLEVLISPPNGKAMMFKPIVKSVIENSEFIWLGRVLFPGIFDGEHKGNINKKLDNHNVENWECEQIFFNEPLIILDDPKHSFSEKRWAAFGKTDANRTLSVTFTKRGKLIRIISARDMSRREKEFYEKNGSKNSEI